MQAVQGGGKRPQRMLVSVPTMGFSSRMLDEVDCFQPSDVVPVVHGQWIEDHDYLKCPECGVMVKRDFTFFDVGDWNFCPNCGEKMDLE